MKSALLIFKSKWGECFYDRGFGGRGQHDIRTRLKDIVTSSSRSRTLILLLLLTLFSAIAIYQSFEKSTESIATRDGIARVYSDLTLRPDYKLEVREIYEIELSADSDRKGFVRSVALWYLDTDFNERKAEISNIQVLDDARGLEILNPKSEQAGGVYKIWVGDPDNPMRAGLNRFVLRYTLSGAVEEGEAGDVLRFAPNDRGMPAVASHQVQLNFDPKLQLQKVRASGWVNLNELTQAGNRIAAGEAQVLMLPKRDLDGVRVVQIEGSSVVAQPGVEQGVEPGAEQSAGTGVGPTGAVHFELLRPQELGESFGVEVRFG